MSKDTEPPGPLSPLMAELRAPAPKIPKTDIAGILDALGVGPDCEIELRIETLKATGKTLEIPEHLRWDPNKPSGVLILARPFAHGACPRCGCALEECECAERERDDECGTRDCVPDETKAPREALECWAEAPLDSTTWTDVHDGKLSAIARELLAARERIAELELAAHNAVTLSLVAATDRADDDRALAAARARIAELEEGWAITKRTDTYAEALRRDRARAVVEAARPFLPKSEPPHATEAHAAWLALDAYDRGES